MENRKKKLITGKSIINTPPTQDGIVRCRFDLFVCLYPEVSSPFNGKVRTWTFRGDKFTKFEPAMLWKLIRHIERKRNLYQMMIIYDNTYEKSSPMREVVKIFKQVVEKNRLFDYKEMVATADLPDFLK